MSGNDGRRGFINHTAVSQKHQRKGIDHQLLQTTLKALKQEGLNKVALVVFSDNEKGNAFWEKEGFSVREDLTYRNKVI